MICIENLTRNYGRLVALDGLNLQVNPGEVFGLIGPNGAGKTTTLKILATLLKPTSGRVEICGFDLAHEACSIREVIGYMPDLCGIYEDTRVDEYLYFFAAAARVTGRKAEATVRDVLELTDLSNLRDALVETLSRGMRQRLSLARVLLHDPKVLLLDEPASGLDPRARVEIRMLIRELCSMDKTVIISSHILSELSELCTTIGIIEKGRLLHKGPVAEIMRLGRRSHVLHVRVGQGTAASANLEAADAIPAAAGSAGDAGTGESSRDENLMFSDLCATGRQAARAPQSGEAALPEDLARRVLLADPRVEDVRLVGTTLEVRLCDTVTDPGFIPVLLLGAGLQLLHFSEEPVTLEDAFMRLTQERAG